MNIDYRSFEGSGNASTSSVQDRRWWTLEGDQIANAISDTLSILRNAQSDRLSMYELYERAYGASAKPNLQPINHGIIVNREGKLTYNVVESTVSTLIAKMAKARPRPLFLTSGGRTRNRTKARKLSAFVDAVFNEVGAYALGRQAVRDALIYGDGIVHVYEHNKRVAWERVLPSELWADEVEGVYGQPRQLHRVKVVDRNVLAELFPRKRSIIKQANPAQFSQQSQTPVGDMVIVRESWHLASAPGANDGKHVLTIDGHLLRAPEPWPYDFFPFAVLRWNGGPLTGFWSDGLVSQLLPTQREINALLVSIQRSLKLMGVPRVYVERGSKIVKEHLSNQIGSVVEYTGTPPQIVAPSVVPPELFSQVEVLIRRAYEQSGISMLSAAGAKPAGLNSGRSLREFQDIETERFMAFGLAYSDFFSELGKLSIALAKQIAEREGSYPVKTRSFREIDWAEVSVQPGDYAIQCFSVASLPRDPAGRLATVEEYASAGYLSPREARRLLGYPDLEQVEDLANAAEEYLMEILDLMVDEGIPVPFDPLDDLPLALELAISTYQQAKRDGVDEDRLELLRVYIAQVEDALNGMPEQDPMALPPGGEAPAHAPAPGMMEPPPPAQGLPAPELSSMLQ